MRARLGHGDLARLHRLAGGGGADQLAELRLARGAQHRLPGGIALEGKHGPEGIVHRADDLLRIRDDHALDHAGQNGVEIEPLLLDVALKRLVRRREAVQLPRQAGEMRAARAGRPFGPRGQGRDAPFHLPEPPQKPGAGNQRDRAGHRRAR